MGIVVLLFIVLFAVAAAIVAMVVMVVINMCKRRREAEEKWQCHKAKQEVRLRAEEKEQQRLEEKRRKDEKERKRLEEEEQQKVAEEARREEDEEQKRLADELEKAQEEHKRVEEEKRRRAQEEQFLKTKKEAQERAEKEELKLLEVEEQRREEERREVEERRHEYEETRKRGEEKVRQKTEEARGGEGRSPDKRGGRPRGLTERPETVQTPGTKTRSPKPEIICWEAGWKWIVGIEVPEELESPSVTQNGELLEQDNTDELRYSLKHTEGTVKVTWTGGEKSISLVGPKRNYYIFKMRKNWKEPGRLIRCFTTGYYLVVIPQEWKRDEEVSGTAPIAPASIQLDGYEAHFFYQNQSGNTVICFITAKGERIRVESGSPRFQLVGREIGDASKYMGPLFGEQLPRIQTLDEKGWSDVGAIVVGEEGSGKNRWRMPFVPQMGAKEQKLPEEIANRHGGWYFVRIYDNDDNLSESMDFRFLTALNDIRMESSDFLPGPNGYDNVSVQFLHQTDCKVELKDEDTQHALEIQRESDQTIVTVPPKPDCDKSHWILRDGDAEIEVTVLVERIWWAFGVIGVTPTDWVDKAITLHRKDFTAISDKALFVRLPRLRFVKKIDVGFERTKSRSYQVEVEKKDIAIPLRYFCDAEEIENRQKEFGLKIWVQPEGAKPDEAIIAKVPADQLISQWIRCGRKKTTVAYAVLRQGSGEFIVNDKPVWMYFKGAPRKAKRFLRRLLELEKVRPLVEKMEIDVKVVRSQPRTNRQIKAVTHAVARALVCYDPRLKRLLKEKGFGGARVTAFSARGKRFVGR